MMTKGSPWRRKEVRLYVKAGGGADCVGLGEGVGEGEEEEEEAHAGLRATRRHGKSWDQSMLCR